MRLFSVSLAVALVATLSAIAPTPAAAQNPLDQFEVTFQTREAQRRATISSTMAFTEEEAATFWPIYDQYRLTAKSHQLRRFRLIQYFSENVVGMDTATAQDIMDKAMAIDTEQLAAKEQFFADLAPHFTGARYFRLYQMETKLKALFRAGWTRGIPLAVTEKELEKLQMGMEAEKQNSNFAPPTT